MSSAFVSTRRKVARGQRVVRGQSIGKLGGTGNTARSALRFDVLWRRRYCDPLDYLLATGCLGLEPRAN